MNNRTVAIAGFSMLTLPALKKSKADEIWTLNHAFVLSDAFPRFDRVFEIHKYHWFLRRGVNRLKEYHKWLRQEHPFPIYMQKQYKKFPASVRFPIEEVNDYIFGKLLRGGKPNLYYASSFSYMLALAIYEKVTRVEVYGVDMGNDTEFNYQKPAGELMIGVALGQGIEVVLQPNSQLCRAQLYAYDRVPSADRKHARHLLEVYLREEVKHREETNDEAELYNNQEKKDPADYLRASAFAAMYQGGIKMLEKILSGDEYYFGRQHLDDERHKYYGLEEGWLALTNQKRAVYQTYAAIDTDGAAGRAYKEFLEARKQMYFYSGARQTMQKLIEECDMRVVPDRLQMELKDV